MARLTDREQETERLAITPGTLTGPVSDDDALDWRWVGEPESWMGLRSERAMAHRPNSAFRAVSRPFCRVPCPLAAVVISRLKTRLATEQMRWA